MTTVQCPKCELRFPNPNAVAWHLRQDHRRTRGLGIPDPLDRPGPITHDRRAERQPESGPTRPSAAQEMSAHLTVTHLYEDAFEVHVRGHQLMVDQPIDAGGADLGPTPTELFLAGLASCVGFSAARYLRRHELADDGLRVECDATMSLQRPARAAAVTLRLAGLPPLTDQQRRALLAVADHCTVHTSLRQPPPVRIELAASQPAATP
jgi:putative redox protein